MADQSTDTSGAFGGCFVLVVIVLVVGGIIYERYFASKAQPVVSLAAYFVDKAGNPVLSKDAKDSHLMIKGDVHVDGKAVPTGNVRLLVRQIDDTFQQVVSTDLKAGHFETDDVALRSLLPIDTIPIRAEVVSADPQCNASETVYLNTAALTLTATQ